MKKREYRTVDGWLLLDKPSGLTSNTALQRVKRLYGARKAGHTGSLDPLASGLLPIGFGEATKFAGFGLDADKTYQVRIRWGARTDTADADGTVVERSPRETVDRPELEAALATLLGPGLQVPPMYSALKHEGRRLYTLARQGEAVVRIPRPIRIDEFAVERFDPAEPAFRVRCSKGTYVRTLAEDLAARLGTLGHVTALRRTAVGPFSGVRMHTPDALEAAAQAGPAALDRLLEPPDALLAGLPALHLDAASLGRLQCGAVVTGASRNADGPLRLYGPDGCFVGIGEVDLTGSLRSRRLLATAAGLSLDGAHG
jgi:tRNA pseudouridine55 synthase